MFGVLNLHHIATGPSLSKICCHFRVCSIICPYFSLYISIFSPVPSFSSKFSMFFGILPQFCHIFAHFWVNRSTPPAPPQQEMGFPGSAVRSAASAKEAAEDAISGGGVRVYLLPGGAIAEIGTIYPYPIWLVVWNINFIFPYIGLLIIPTDFPIFQRGGPTTNQPILLRDLTNFCYTMI